MDRWNTLARKTLRRNTNRGHNELNAGSDIRAQFIDACCGKLDDSPCALDCGLETFAALTERRMLEYEDATKELLHVLWSGASPGSGSGYLASAMATATQIVKLVREATVKMTIDDIVNDGFRHFGLAPAEAAQSHKDAMRHLVFAVVGWSTMLYTPNLNSTDGDFSTLTSPNGSFIDSPAKQSLEQSSRRPLGVVLRNYGLMPIACPPGAGSSSPLGLPTLLTVTHLNFFSLSKLGDVEIDWVDDLSKHCEFDRYSKRKKLKLFRLPSLCARICLNPDAEVLVGRLFRSHICQQNCRATLDTVARSYLVEVLLSYRLLLGQNTRSRRLFREQELEKARCMDQLDPLLSALCGEKDVGDIGVGELLRERGVYNAPTNFPHLGPRLMELQDYSTSQRPRNIKEVWNDGRDPERLLTFRAVIIVGGISIGLSFLQLLVGVAQLVVSIVK